MWLKESAFTAVAKFVLKLSRMPCAVRKQEAVFLLRSN
jgi:hypothetical protein